MHTSRFDDIITQNPFHRVWLTPQKDYFVFKVKACEHAQIALSRTPGLTNQSSYVITLALDELHSSITYIDMEGQEVVKAQGLALRVLDCNVMRPFWVKWENSRLELGKGPLNYERLITMDEMMVIEVNSVAVSTSNVTNGEWEFYRGDGEQKCICNFSFPRGICPPLMFKEHINLITVCSKPLMERLITHSKLPSHETLLCSSLF